MSIASGGQDSAKAGERRTIHIRIHGQLLTLAEGLYGLTCDFLNLAAGVLGHPREKGHVMAQQRDALTELVQQHVGTHTGPDKMSVAAFVQKAIDPVSKYQPSNGLIGKIVRGQGYTVTPKLVGAIAAGLGLPREIVAAAAHLQLIGYEETELEGGAPAALMRRLDAEPGEPERAVADKWATETGQ